MQLEKLKQLLGIPLDDTTKDFPLQFIMEKVVESIINYCNIEELPDGLINTAYSMCIERFRKEVNSDGSMAAASSGDTYVSSITEGDTSISYSQKTTQTQTSTGTDSIMGYEKILNKYRRVVFR